MLETIGGFSSWLLGLGKQADELTLLNMAVRAVITFTFAVAVVRLGKTRWLGKETVFDVLLGFILGATIARAINTSSPFFETLAVGALLVALHALMAWGSFHSQVFGRLVKGQPIEVIAGGRLQEAAMRNTLLSRHDLEQMLRVAGRSGDLDQVVSARLERSGAVTFTPRPAPLRVLEVKVEAGVQTIRIQIEGQSSDSPS